MQTFINTDAYMIDVLGNHIIDHTFIPEITKISSVSHKESTDTILSEPLLIGQFTINKAKEHGGYLTNKIIDEIFKIDGEKINEFCDKYKRIMVVSTRSVEMDKGFSPISTFWHCDGFRKFQYRGTSLQPDIKNTNHKAFHYACTISNTDNGTSNTEFITSTLICKIYIGEGVWNSLGDYISKQEKQIETIHGKDGDILKFAMDTIHRATPAHTNGCRYLFRMQSIYKNDLEERDSKVIMYSDISERVKACTRRKQES